MFGYKIAVEKTAKAPKASKTLVVPKSPKPDKPAKIKKRMSKKKRALIVLAALLVLAGIGAFAANKTMTGPAIGTVVSTIPAVTRVPQIELKQFDGTNLSFALPVTFTEQIVKQQPGNTNNLESHTFISSEMMTQVLVMTVTKLPSGNMEDDPSFMLRKQETAKYSMKPIVLKNEKVVIFTSNDTQQMQQTAFWAHGGKLLTITLSGVAANPQTTTGTFDDMLASIAWR